MKRLDRYTCEQVFHLLDDYVDRELTSGEIERVEEHLETCADCAKEARFEEGVLQGLKAKIRRIEVPRSVIDGMEAIFESLGRKGADPDGTD